MTNTGDGTASIVDVESGDLSGTVAVGDDPTDVAAAPGGDFAYAVADGAIVPLDTAAASTFPPIAVAPGLDRIAIEPQGFVAYVSQPATGVIVPVHLAERRVFPPIPVGLEPRGVAVTPDGLRVLVANAGSSSVTIVDRSSGVAGLPIIVGERPTEIVVHPDGDTAYVASENAQTVTPIDIETRTVGTPIPLPVTPTRLAITPDGSTLYVGATADDVVVPIDLTAAPPSVGSPSTFDAPVGLAVTPDQAPVADLELSPQSGPVGTTVDFDASDSTVEFGTIEQYIWYFGDSDVPVVTTVPTASHTYTSVGTFSVAVGAVSSAGTSTQASFTGQTASRNVPTIDGVPQSVQFATVTITGSTADGVDGDEFAVFVTEAGGGGVAASNLDQLGDPGGTERIPTGSGPSAVAVTPDAQALVVTNASAGTVTPVAACTDGDAVSYATGAPAVVGGFPTGIAVAPSPVSQTADQSVWWVAVVSSTGGTLTRLTLTVDHNACTASFQSDLTTRTLPIPVGLSPHAVAITPNGTTAYVTNGGAGSVTPVNLVTGRADTPIPVGLTPQGIAVTPDGRTVYVANSGSDTVTPIDTTNRLPGQAIAVGDDPYGVAITPDGATVYVSNRGSGSITPIATSGNAPGEPIELPFGISPTVMAIAPGGRTLYATAFTAGAVVPVDLASATAGAAITGFNSPLGIAITPDQAPVTEFTITPGTVTAGATVTFDASASTVRFGSITEYLWYFGDSPTPVTTTSPVVTHVYTAPGTYTMALGTTSSAGTSVFTLHTGQTASRNVPIRNGLPQSVKYGSVTVVAGGGSNIPGDTPVVYVANTSTNRVTPVAFPDGDDPILGGDVPVASGPSFVDATSDGEAFVVTNFHANAVTPVAACLTGGSIEHVAGDPAGTGSKPTGVAISPVPTSMSATQSTWTVLVADSGGNTVRRYVLTIDRVACSASLAPAQPITAFIIPVDSAPYDIAIDTTGTFAYVANSGAGTLTRIDLATNRTSAPIPVGRNPRGVAISPSGATAYVANLDDDTVTTVSTTTNLPGTVISVGNAPFDVVVSPDGLTVYVSNSEGGSVTPILTSSATAQSPITMPGGRNPTGLAISDDGASLYATSFSGAVVPIDTASGTTGDVLVGFGSPLGITAARTPG